ncbi:putative RNA recognition motif domain, nucleotide-binding alpha-beta plait domain superfamily [Helianthus annuus]|uniref:RNA recognition motif domain, nucleotide-binding alpha-beta plait domain superfamily n=1 Tax=Helianthus annuus TaxID=4232 RepID=A0A9K3H8P5_HELAN|nr:putative RNA recognition motif domain, nucleotide-binding alpha-beta plait domain superfamily [Helianthus annuus]KAJ0464344.1 putative RNA recognition motif domain, nucleotide-binding alpha-beta plait domain superfamily [Helianthus annuus]
MDQHSNSPRSYDNSGPQPYHDGGPFNHGGHYNRRRRYQNNNYQDAGSEASDSFGYSNGTTFSGRERPFSQSVHGPPEFFDDGKCNKLYVSSVPREVTEEDICSLFGEHGTSTEVVLFEQLKNLQQHGCCLVKYATIKDASQAIKALNNQYTFPGRLRPIEVKYATKKPERPALGFLKTHENKLLNGGHESQVFVSFFSKHASKSEIAEVWSGHHQRIIPSPATSGGPSSFSAISGRVQSCYLELDCLPSAIYATRLCVTSVFTHPPATTLLHSSPACVPCHRHTQHIPATSGGHLYLSRHFGQHLYVSHHL